MSKEKEIEQAKEILKKENKKSFIYLAIKELIKEENKKSCKIIKK